MGRALSGADQLADAVAATAMKPDPLASLSIHFALLSLVAIGGANAVVPEMHRLAVETDHWMSDQEFADLFAISSAAPGPNVLIVSLIGFKLAGIAGALVATLAMCGPSSLLTFWVTRFWRRAQGAPWQDLVRRALAPITIGLVIASGWVLGRAADHDWLGVGFTAVTVTVLLASRLNPLWLLGAAGLLGLAGIG
jgi:chromate transporter